MLTPAVRNALNDSIIEDGIAIIENPTEQDIKDLKRASDGYTESGSSILFWGIDSDGYPWRIQAGE